MRSSDILLGTVCIFAMVLSWALAGRLHEMQHEIATSRELVSRVPLGGFQKFAADIEWMLFLQYLGANAQDEKNAPEIYRRARRITRLDPDFRRVYYEGALMLSSANPELALDLIDTGLEHPTIRHWWRLPMLAGITLMRDQRFIYMRDEGPMNVAIVERAREYFRHALNCPDGHSALGNFIFCDAYVRFREQGQKPFVFHELDGWLEAWREQNRYDEFGGSRYGLAAFEDGVPPHMRLEERLLAVLRRIHRDHPDYPELDTLTGAILAEVWPDTRFNMATLTPFPRGSVSSFTGLLQRPADRGYALDLSAKFSYALVEMTLRATPARGQATLTVNGAPVPGLENIPLTANRLTTLADNPFPVARGDLVELRLNGVDGVEDMAYSIEYFR